MLEKAVLLAITSNCAEEQGEEIDISGPHRKEIFLKANTDHNLSITFDEVTSSEK